MASKIDGANFGIEADPATLNSFVGENFHLANGKGSS